MNVDVAANLKKITDTLPQGVRLVAVSKFHPDEYVEAAYNAGQRVFGESHEQELSKKQQTANRSAAFHFH